MRLGIALLALLVIPAAAHAQKKKRSCTGTEQDTTAAPAFRIYRDCEVDKPARVRGNEPRPDMSGMSSAGMGSGGCIRAQFEFVVDTAGMVEPVSVRNLPGNDRFLEEAVLVTLRDLRYDPALLNGSPVRQLVLYKVAVAVGVVVTTGGRPVGLPPRPPHC